MSVDIEQVVQRWHANQPHPSNPALTVGEFAMAVRLATKAKFGGHASPQEAGAFWTEFKGMNERLTAAGKPAISPEEFGQVLDRLAPISFALHGRPPSMPEIAKHRESEPAAVSKYFADLPDKHYPLVSAGEMAKYMQIAHDQAIEKLGRPPNKLEVSRFALAKLSPDAIGTWYETAAGPQYLRPNITPPVAGDWGGAKPGVGPAETGITERRLGGDRRGGFVPWGAGRGPERRGAEPSPPPESGGAETGATQ